MGGRIHPPALDRELAIKLGLLVPEGNPSPPHWHHEPATLRMDERGKALALVHVAQGPVREYRRP